MLYKAFFSSFILLVAVVFSAQAQVHVRFVMHSPAVKDGEVPYIAGSLKALGNWDAAAVPMIREGREMWTKDIEVPAGESIEYKYTLGSWNKEAADANGLVFPNLTMKAMHDTVVETTVSFFSNKESLQKAPDHVTGDVRHLGKMHGDGLLDREVIVWLPFSYDKRQDLSYSVMYMHDGQNLFNPATSSFGVDWAIDETMDSLIHNGLIQPMIVVGIYNTSERSEDYMGSKTDLYIDFIIHVVKPYIDKNYRTLPDREHTLVGGSSAGGVVSFEAMVKHPDVFSKALCMAPAFKYKTWDFLSAFEKMPPIEQSLRFYMDCGDDGVDTKILPGVKEMNVVLAKKGYVEGKDYKYIFFPGGKHFESDWAKHFPAAIQWLLNGK
jgi:predicted alpha/beta superfamily hydrolase